MYNRIIECLLIVLVLDAMGYEFKTWQWWVISIPVLFILVYLRKMEVK